MEDEGFFIMGEVIPTIGHLWRSIAYCRRFASVMFELTISPARMGEGDDDEPECYNTLKPALEQLCRATLTLFSVKLCLESETTKNNGNRPSLIHVCRVW